MGWDAPLKFTTVFEHEHRDWFVLAQFLRDGPPLFLGKEPLKDFPSEFMIAQCMLVC